VSSHVKFNNHFVSAEELVEQVGAADIYITPYRQEAQVVSGTLAIALGAMECPAFYVPVLMRETGQKGAEDGEGQEAYT